LSLTCHHLDEVRFLTDRMLGTLTRYLRFMGYDTVSANQVPTGDPREDTTLLDRARKERRTLLTRDRELSRRAGEKAIWIESEDIREQVRQLAARGFIHLKLRMNRCSLCNEPLRPAGIKEIAQSIYAPHHSQGLEYYWCIHCRKLYWMGSHSADLSRRLEEFLSED
jgi:uncharacterized protein with PIN domain